MLELMGRPYIPTEWLLELKWGLSLSDELSQRTAFNCSLSFCLRSASLLFWLSKVENVHHTSVWSGKKADEGRKENPKSLTYFLKNKFWRGQMACESIDRSSWAILYIYTYIQAPNDMTTEKNWSCLFHLPMHFQFGSFGIRHQIRLSYSYTC